MVYFGAPAIRSTSALSVALCGVALVFSLDWMLILILPAFVILHFAVVVREERYLEQ